MSVYNFPFNCKVLENATRKRSSAKSTPPNIQPASHAVHVPRHNPRNSRPSARQRTKEGL